MRLSISHDTTYRYDDQVRASIQYLRLTPHDSERQQGHPPLPRAPTAQTENHTPVHSDGYPSPSPHHGAGACARG